MIAMTPAKIGRRMKKWLKRMEGSALVVAAKRRLGGARAGRRRGALERGRSATRTCVTRGFTLLPGHGELDALDDDPVGAGRGPSG